METLSPEMAIDLVMIFVCLVCSAFFSSSETAITSLGPLKTKHLIENLPAGESKHLELWLHHPGRVLTTILVFNNLVNILAAAIATKIALQHSNSYGVGVATGTITMLILIFGEITPKSFGKANPEPLANIGLRVIRVLYQACYPIIWCLSELAALIIKSLGSAETSLKPAITEEELEFLISEGESAGVIEDYKKEMISGVFDFDETKVREIMTPRIDINAVDKTSEFDEVLKLTIRTGHSRIPVYDENIDHIIGIVFAKDLLRLIAQSTSDSPKKITSIMREPFFVPESKSNIEVFKELKRTKNQMAVVIDEHGGTAGLVTMEDLLEEIVGDIQDEFDVEEAKILELDNSVYDVAGSVHIAEFLEYFDMNEEDMGETEQDVDTIAGFVTQRIGAMPKVGQAIEMGTLRLEVSEIGRHRIERLRVNRLPLSQMHEESIT